MTRRPVLHHTPCSPRRGRCLHRPVLPHLVYPPPVGRGALTPPPHRTPCNAFVGATLAVARPLHLLLRFRRGRCLHRPDLVFFAPTAGHAGPALQKCPVGRYPCVPPPYRTPCKNYVIARAHRARGNPPLPSPKFSQNIFDFPLDKGPKCDYNALNFKRQTCEEEE